MFGGIAAIISYFFKTEKLVTVMAIAAISIFAMVVRFSHFTYQQYFQLNHIANSLSLILINLFVFSVVSIPAGFLADKFTSLHILLIGVIGLVIFGSIFYYSAVY